MKDVKISILVGAVIVSVAACGILKEKRSAPPPAPLVNAPVEAVPMVSEADVAKMPRSFTDAESMGIPRQTLEKQITDNPTGLRFKSGLSFSDLVRDRAFICSFSNKAITSLLKAAIKDGGNASDGETFGAFLGRLFPPGQGHFLQAWGQPADGYQASETFAGEDAVLLRKFYCLGTDAVSYVDGSITAFESVAAPETSAKLAELNLTENVGVDCSATPSPGDRVLFSVRWNPADSFVREKIPAMKVEWQVDGVDLRLPPAVIKIGAVLNQELTRNPKAAIYSARLSDSGGRIVLMCARLLLPDDDSVGVGPRQDEICGLHAEKRNQAVDYQVEVDAGFRDAPRLKTYETTCGGSVESYHTACDGGETVVDNSHHNAAEECIYKKEVCVGGGLIPRVCQEVPEIRHRNKGSIMCQNQTRTTRLETRTRVDVVDVTVTNTCDVPFKK